MSVQFYRWIIVLVQAYRSGPSERSQKARGLAVAEIFWFQARRGFECIFQGNSRSATLIRATESVLAFAGAYGCQIGLEARSMAWMRLVTTEILTNTALHGRGGARCNRRLWFARRNVFGLCQWRNGARMRSAVVEKIEIQVRYSGRHMAQDWLQYSAFF
jgi:hypothetical protein